MRSSGIILVCALAQENIVLAQEDDSWQLDFESYPIGSTIVTVTMLLPSIIACLFQMI